MQGLSDVLLGINIHSIRLARNTCTDYVKLCLRLSEKLTVPIYTGILRVNKIIFGF